MKFYLYIVFSILILSCNSEEGSDCFKKQGDQITESIAVEHFSKINISKGIELTIKESDEQKVIITAGENLIHDINFEVVDNELFITDRNGCDMFRNVSIAKVEISTPVLEEVYSGSQFSVISEGILHFPELTFSSGIDEETASSLFDLNIENEKLTINDNVSSVFKIRGNTHHLFVNFWGSNGRLEAENLMANQIDVFHRSTNDMIVYPTERIAGTLYSTGNLVLKNQPPIIEVQQLYTGAIIYD